MKRTLLILQFFICTLLLSACKRTDFDEIRRTQERQQEQLDSQAARLAALELAMKTLNQDFISLRSIVDALQKNLSIRSYAPTANGYLLTMSDGSTIALTNGKDGQNGSDGNDGKDGINAPQVGVKQDTDGIYYWTLGGSFILQNGQQLRVTGRDGTNGSNGNDAATPLLQVNATANQWLISYDSGQTWAIVRDKDGNPVPAIGPTGPQGPAGPTGPAGTNDFKVTDGDGFITITYMGSTFTVPKLPWQVFRTQGDHSLYLSPSGTLYGAGSNGSGRLGQAEPLSFPLLTPILDDVTSAEGGLFHTLILKKDGSLYATGDNLYGQLGTGDKSNRYTPVLVMTGVTAIAAGQFFSLALKADGSLYGTGLNSSGQLGLGHNQSINTFQPITDNVGAISAGDSFSLVLKRDGTLYASGQNIYGQLGTGGNGSVRALNFVTDQVKKMSAGNAHSLVLKNDGSLHAAGLNSAGQLGLGNQIHYNSPQVVDITGVDDLSAGRNFSILSKTDGSLWGMGTNSDRQLGIITTGEILKPTLLMTDARTSSLAAGREGSAIIKHDGLPYVTGRNNSGRFGLGTTDEIVNTFTKIKLP